MTLNNYITRSSIVTIDIKYTIIGWCVTGTVITLTCLLSSLWVVLPLPVLETRVKRQNNRMCPQ